MLPDPCCLHLRRVLAVNCTLHVRAASSITVTVDVRSRRADGKNCHRCLVDGVMVILTVPLLALAFAAPVATSCMGESNALPADQCSAWIAFFVATGGPKWNFCNTNKKDPCGCKGWDGKSPVCNAAGTAVVLM
jgi:hypothetical protein